MRLLTSTQDLTSRGRLHLGLNQQSLAPYIKCQDPCLSVALPPCLRSHLTWWTEESNILGGVSLTELSLKSLLFVDASLQVLDQTTSGCRTDLRAVIWHQAHLAHQQPRFGGALIGDITQYFVYAGDNTLSLPPSTDVSVRPSAGPTFFGPAHSQM